MTVHLKDSETKYFPKVHALIRIDNNRTNVNALQPAFGQPGPDIKGCWFSQSPAKLTGSKKSKATRLQQHD